MEKKKNKRLIILVAILLIGIGASFAIYTIRIALRGEGAKTKGKTAQLGDTIINVEGELDFHDTNIYPGHQNISSLKVTATGDRLTYYTITWTGTNTLQTSLKYTIYKTTIEETPSITCEKKQEGNLNTIYYEECTHNNFDNLGEPIDTGSILSNEESTSVVLAKDYITATKEGTTVYYYVILEFQETGEEQNYDMNGTFNGEIFIELIDTGSSTSAKEYILAGKMIGERTNVGEAFPTVALYKQVEATSTSNAGTISASQKISYSDSYIFNEETGKYSLVNPITAPYSEISNNLIGKYVVTSTDYENVNNIYRVSSTTQTSYYSYRLSSEIVNWKNEGGIYQAPDDDGTSYYYAGVVNDNYVKFGKWAENTPDVYFGYSQYDESKDFSTLEECQNDSKYNHDCTLIQRAGKDMYWRIVRINGDNSVRLIYDGTEAYMDILELKKDSQISSSVFNSQTGDKMYIGYMYGYANEEFEDTISSGPRDFHWFDQSLSVQEYYYSTEYTFNSSTGMYKLSGEVKKGPRSEDVVNKYTCGKETDEECKELYYIESLDSNELFNVLAYMRVGNKTYANTSSSTIKTVIDAWYQNNILNQEYHNYIDSNAGFCGDRTTYFISSYVSNRNIYYSVGNNISYAYFGSGTRLLYSQIPSFKCSQTNDLYTISSSNKGNKALIYPVGLITTDELIYSGANISDESNNFLMGKSYWTMSPAHAYSYENGENGGYIFLKEYYGILQHDVANYSSAVRPVINLRADVKLSGTGTRSNPYVVEGVE